MRAILILSALALFIGACSKNDCEKAGGKCEQITPGACLGLVSGDDLGYSCASSATVCCLPLRYSPCEKAGGTCVQMGACATGAIGDTSTYGCSNNGGVLECCLPSADGGK
jgi:hypothetical protein